jgi:protein phosphatase
MKIAVFSDIHANLSGLNAVLDAINRRGDIDHIVAAGDLVTDGPRPVETFDRLLEAGCLLLLGNHDEHLLGRGYEWIKPEKAANTWAQTLWAREKFDAARLEILAAQPFERLFKPAPDVAGHDLLIVHANLNDTYGKTGNSERPADTLHELYGHAPAGVEIIAFGHWHAASVREWNNLKLVNVGSVAYPKDKEKLAGYTLFSWDGQKWDIEQHRVPFDWREEARLLLASGMTDLWQMKYYEEG